jgi:hypothetical protein
MDESNQEKTKVGFPSASEPKKSGNGKIIVLIVIILLILGGASWFLLSRKEETIEFTNESVTPSITEETPTPEETATPERNTLKIQIQNGTGTPGDAGKLEKALKDLGFTETSTGNADNYDYDSAEVTFSEDFPETYKQEIMDKLSTMYKSVKEGSATLGSFNAILITGNASGSGTTKSSPSPIPTKKVSATLTPTAKSTVSPTP